MKHLWTAILMMTLIGCRDDEFPVPDRYTGQATAQLNGEAWRGWVDVGDQQDSIFIMSVRVFNNQGYLRESFSIQWIRYNHEKQDIHKKNYESDRSYTQSSYGTSIDGGDAGNHYYDVDTLSSNYLQITDFNPSTGEISGEFQVTFHLTRQGQFGPDPPEKLVFEEGRFNGRFDPIPEWED